MVVNLTYDVLYCECFMEIRQIKAPNNPDNTKAPISK